MGGDDEALRWLEGLAAQQGASPDELLTTPPERLVETPDWIAAEQSAAQAAQESQAEAPMEPPPLAEPEPAAAILPPDWQPAPPTTIEEAPIEAFEPPAAEVATGVTADLDRLSRLADRLAAARRSKELEIEARFAEQRAQQEAARRQVQERMEAWRQTVEGEAASPPPAAAVEAPAAGTEAPAPAPASSLRETAAEFERYASQIEGGGDLSAIVRELRQLAASPTSPAPVWRLLGDACARSDQLQEALEAYRTALSRL
jgi:hypothetical protein